MITEVCPATLPAAAYVHAESWQASHRGFCSAAFVAQHTPERQAAYLQAEMDAGKRLYLLCTPEPVGIVSIQNNLIENLYVLPQEQRKGYGAMLLRFAIERCNGVPTLWVLDNNPAAIRLYQANGFQQTGQRTKLRENLFELEMRKL